MRKKLEGFSLIEISIVLLVIGIMAGGVLKGRDLIESAQINSVADDLRFIQTAFDSYVSSYENLPGDDPSASSKFPDATNGNGNGTISAEEAGKVFEHLFYAGLIDNIEFKKPKVGGRYDVISEDGILKLQLSNNGSPFLTSKQVRILSARVSEIIGVAENWTEAEPKMTDSPTQRYLVKMRIQ